MADFISRIDIATSAGGFVFKNMAAIVSIPQSAFTRAQWETLALAAGEFDMVSDACRIMLTQKDTLRLIVGRLPQPAAAVTVTVTDQFRRDLSAVLAAAKWE